MCLHCSGWAFVHIFPIKFRGEGCWGLGYFVPSYYTFFDATCPFLFVLMHKTPNISHSWLALLGLLCSVCIRVRPLMWWLTLRTHDTGRRGGGGQWHMLCLACFARLILGSGPLRLRAHSTANSWAARYVSTVLHLYPLCKHSLLNFT